MSEHHHHQLLFAQMLTEKAAKSGDADNQWVAFLYIATASPALYEVLMPIADLEKATVDFGKLQTSDTYRLLATSDRIFVNLAKHLYQARGAVNIAEAAEVLDERGWSVFRNAIWYYRLI